MVVFRHGFRGVSFGDFCQAHGGGGAADRAGSGCWILARFVAGGGFSAGSVAGGGGGFRVDRARASQLGPATPLADRPIVAIDSLAFYCGKLFWPAGLTIDYGAHAEPGADGTHLLRQPGDPFDAGADFVADVAELPGNRAGSDGHGGGIAAGPGPGAVWISGIFDGGGPFFISGDAGAFAGGRGDAGVGAGAVALPIAAALVVGLAVLSAEQLKIWRNSATLVARALAIDPGSAIGNDIVGAQLDRSGKPEMAVPFFSAAITRDPSNPEFHYNLGTALFRMGEYEKSIVELQAAIPLFNPPSWKAMNNLGVAYAKVGRRDEAIGEFQQVLKIDPKNAEALQNLQFLGGGVPSR